MEKETQLQLVNFGQAKRLANAGFNWETDKLYCKPFPSRPEYLVPNSAGITDHHLCFSPTVSLALKWFRDEKGIYGAITRDRSGWYFTIHNREGDVVKFFDNETWPTYESAESALLDELLTLIEKEK